MITRTIIHNGVMTVINNAEPLQQNLNDFYKHLDNFYRIDAQGQQIIQQNNQLLDQCNQLTSQIQAQLQQLQNPDAITRPIQQLSRGGSAWNDFLQRGNFSNSSINKGQDGILNTDYWANFVNEVVKKTLWLLWNSFMSFSHWLFLLIAVAGLIAFIAGWKKGGVVSICSIVFYILLRLVNMAIGG